MVHLFFSSCSHSQVKRDAGPSKRRHHSVPTAGGNLSKEYTSGEDLVTRTIASGAVGVKNAEAQPKATSDGLSVKKPKNNPKKNRQRADLVKNHACNFCDKRFAVKWSVLRHAKKIHPDKF